VHYPDTGGARAALVVYRDPMFAALDARLVAELDDVAPYRPGNFYERELPAIRAVLARTEPVDLLVVDGFVDLDPAGRPGLGAHVHAELGRPVIGVAKTFFRSATHAVPVLRGSSRRPLYVTAAGLPLAEAAALIATMHGATRLPTALALVDRLARRR
jgi:deoxyribonuclease V